MDSMESLYNDEETISSASKGMGPLRLFFLVLFSVLGAGALVLGILYMTKADQAGAQAAGVFEQIPVGQQALLKNMASQQDAGGQEGSLEDPEETGEEEPPHVPDGVMPIAVEDTDGDDLITISFAGDILFDPYYATGSTAAARGLANCFDEAALANMRESDLFIVNNEFTYTDSNAAQEGKKYTFHARPESAEWLKEIGTDLVTLANNHTYDYGEQGLIDTLDTLDGIGMPHVGAGRNLEEAIRPQYFTVGSKSIAVINATQIERYDTPNTKAATETSAGVFRCYDPTLLYSIVEQTRQVADFVIVCVHWGTEKVTEIEYGQSSQAEELSRLGADLVIGCHPHILQPIGWIGEMPVVYSLGNYFFTSFTVDTCLIRASVRPSDMELVSLQFIPMLQSNCTVTTLEGGEKERVLQDMRNMSPDVVIDGDGFVSRKQ